MVKNPPANEGNSSLISGPGRSPRRRDWLPTPVFLPGEFHGQRSPEGYSPWHHKESDTTKLLNTRAYRVAELPGRVQH